MSQIQCISVKEVGECFTDCDLEYAQNSMRLALTTECQSC